MLRFFLRRKNPGHSPPSAAGTMPNLYGRSGAASLPLQMSGSSRDGADVSPDGLRDPGVDRGFLFSANQFAEKTLFMRSPEKKLLFSFRGAPVPDPRVCGTAARLPYLRYFCNFLIPAVDFFQICIIFQWQMKKHLPLSSGPYQTETHYGQHFFRPVHGKI